MMTICPLISSYDKITRCRENCALLIDGECALKVLAKAKLAEQQAKSDAGETDHK